MSEFDRPRKPWVLVDYLYRGLVIDTVNLLELAPVIRAAREAGDTATVDRLMPSYDAICDRAHSARWGLWEAGWTEEQARRFDESEAIRERRPSELDRVRGRLPDGGWDGAWDALFREQEAPSWVA